MEIRNATFGPFSTNCYLVWEDPAHAVLIDAGYLPEAIAAKARGLALTVDAILVTHGHGDHMLGAEVLREMFACALYYPEADLPYATGEFLGETYPVPHPQHLLRGGEKLELGGLTIDVLRVPGHTPGHVAFRIGDDLFPGDCLFYDSIGRTDLEGGDRESLYRSLGELLALPDETRVYPGHGPRTTIGRERWENPFLAGL